MDRRQFLKTSGFAALAAGGGVLASPAIVRAAEGGPIRIGLMAPQTGVVTAPNGANGEGVPPPDGAERMIGNGFTPRSPTARGSARAPP